MDSYGNRRGQRQGYEERYEQEYETGHGRGYARGQKKGDARGRRKDNRYDEDDIEMRDKISGSGSTLRRLDSIQDPGKRYALKDRIGSGVCGDVYEAIDQQAGNKKVAIKIQKLTPETETMIIEEYRVLRDFAGHTNLPDFYGIHRKRSGKKNEPDEIWFVMELCDGGSVMDLVRGLIASARKMREEHIAYILKEVIKALIHLHEHNVIHRDVRGSNIVLTKEGEIRLVDFGLSRTLKAEMEKRYTCIGSPCWMAPEVAIGNSNHASNGYDSRVDVWAIGITAIELADGKPPFQDMHPTRALFQIVRNPPPTLYRPADWSGNFNDFVTECLEKNPENRPVMAEIVEHPFLTSLPENDYTLTQEIKALAMDVTEHGKINRKPEVIVHKNFLKTHQEDPPEPMLMEDLAALENLTEDTILDELHERLRQGYYHSFVGDVLLILNPNQQHNIYGPHFHAKYQCKSRSDNAPHIYSVADSAYQDVLHNEEAQHILLAGESNSGKTTNMLHLVEHLFYLGRGLEDVGTKVMCAIKFLHAFTNAATPLNPNSTRCILQIQTTYGQSGRASGAIIWLYQLEKWRVSTRDKNQSNFHVFYYLYDGLEAKEMTWNYSLPPGRRMRYLRISEKGNERKRSFKIRNDPDGNVENFENFEKHMALIDMKEHRETIRKTLAAILLLGEIRFIEGSNGEADLDSNDIANKVADLLNVDQKKFAWSLINYCLIKKGAAVRRKHMCEEAKEARDVLANTIYQRLVDWIVNMINHTFTGTRSLYGDKFSIDIMDLFGFECFSVNRFEQLVVNTTNEQLQCYYNQRVFAWEMQEQIEEDIPAQKLHFYDNKDAVEQLMGKHHGLFHIIDEASRQLQDVEYVLGKIKRHTHGMHLKVVSGHEFTIAHYTGKLTYDASEMPEKNRDFLPPEMIETMRLSTNETVKQLFSNKLTKSGNLTIASEQVKVITQKKTCKDKWSAAMQDSTKLRRYNTSSKGQFSQTRRMRTCAGTFRSTSLEILKNLSGSGGTHFIRCIRADLQGVPRGFHREVVKQQIRALAVLDTARARQRGYPHRIPFQEFLRRYKFLAFEFDENVEMTKDNCRLLLIRLKMEGWIIGKTKVFLKYYNEEYLSRLYETQVKKIIKVQCMMRSFLARKRLAFKITRMKTEIVKQASIKQTNAELSEDDAALILQKAYRGHVVRKDIGPLRKTEMNEETKDFIKFYGSKWKSKSMFQVLLRYRAARYQDLVQFSQQVHLFNQAIVGNLDKTNDQVTLDKIIPNVKPCDYLDPIRPPQVHKLPFDVHQELPFFDASYINDPMKMKKKARGSITSSVSDEEIEAWDAPLRRQTVPWANENIRTKDAEVQTTNSPHRIPQRREQSLIDVPFSRDPNVPIRCPPDESSRKADFMVGSRVHAANSPVPESRATRSNSVDFGSQRSKKRAPPPPIPINQYQPMRGYTNYNADVRNKSNVNGEGHDLELENRLNRNTNTNDRVNPIQELQMLGRRNTIEENANEDEPPFNFQAMLRKTSHQRASMKRTQIYDSYAPSPLGVSTPTPISRSGLSGEYRRFNDNYEEAMNRNEDSQRDSPEWSPNEMVRMSEKYGRMTNWDNNGDDGDNGPGSVTAEIAPGIVVEGHVAEL